MKKLNKKLKVKGLQASALNQITAVRWLGAYGHNSDIAEMAAWEKSPHRQVACEVILKGESNIRRAHIGLLVDVEKTSINKAFAGDAWTNNDRKSDKLYADRSHYYVNKWKFVNSLASCLRKGKIPHSGGKYVEAIIEKPQYLAIVIDSNGKAVLNFALKLCKLMNLPVATLYNYRKATKSLKNKSRD